MKSADLIPGHVYRMKAAWRQPAIFVEALGGKAIMRELPPHGRTGTRPPRAFGLAQVVEEYAPTETQALIRLAAEQRANRLAEAIEDADHRAAHNIAGALTALGYEASAWRSTVTLTLDAAERLVAVANAAT